MFYYHNNHYSSLNILFKEVFLYSNLFCSLVCTMLYLHKWKNWIENYNVGLMEVFSCHFVSRSQAQLESWRLCLKENFCTRFLSSLSVVVEDMVHTYTKLLSQLASFHGNVTNSKSQSSWVSLPLNIGAQKILLALHLDVVKEGHY